MGSLSRSTRCVRAARIGALGLAFLLSAPHAHAAPPPERAADPRAEAREHYSRALALYNDGNIAGALVEFERANNLAPSYRILYNIALCHSQLHNYAQALDMFERYLEEGGDAIPPERVDDVRSRMARLRDYVGFLSIRTTPDGASLFVDDIHVGTTPLDAPVRVALGRHRLRFAHPGYETEVRVVEVAAGETVDVTVPLRQNAPTVALRPPAPEPSPLSRVSAPHWIGLGAAAVTTAVLGGFAYGAAQDHDRLRRTPGVDRDELSAAYGRSLGLGVAFDAAALTTLVLGGLAVYRIATGGKKQTSAALLSTGVVRF
jgi:hypothetical protein